MEDTHMETFRQEMAALVVTEWEEWADAVEKLAGHNLDGTVLEDGYSMDTFYAMWELGWTPERATAASYRVHESLLP